MGQFERKIEAGEALAAAVRQEEEARAALAAASADVARARQSALRAGWSEAELKKLGLVPTVRASRTRTPRQASSAATAEHPAAGGEAGAEPDAYFE